ncbi:hypothetical protein [Thermopetrobacter sp. TC1]|uniref:hypothetical protein n=1 Tax=Thermopetrobacter sp. TC1 TaxID=1495045 RepID=UPI00056E9420|nr:hypothetical protein [Thermopetrobacter sp. TC1]
MGSKILVALLLIALVLMTFKFMREREARLRERAARAEKDRRRASVGQSSDDAGDQPPKTVTLRKDPKTGAWVPDEEK